MLFTVHLFGGRMGILEARTLESARKRALAEEGSANVLSVRPATDADKTWLTRMGGTVQD